MKVKAQGDDGEDCTGAGTVSIAVRRVSSAVRH